MTTLALAKKKWARKMRDAGTKWKKGVTGKGSAYGKGLATFLGVTSISPEVVRRYTEGIEAVTPEEFQSAIRGKEDKWARRLREALT